MHLSGQATRRGIRSARTDGGRSLPPLGMTEFFQGELGPSLVRLFRREEPAPLQHGLQLRLRRAELLRAGQEWPRLDRMPVAPAAVGESRDVERFDRAVDARDQKL